MRVFNFYIESGNRAKLNWPQENDRTAWTAAHASGSATPDDGHVFGGSMFITPAIDQSQYKLVSANENMSKVSNPKRYWLNNEFSVEAVDPNASETDLPVIAFMVIANEGYVNTGISGTI